MQTNTRDEVYEEILQANGEAHEINICMEELSELTTELARVNRGRQTLPDVKVLDEIADVQNCVENIKYILRQKYTEINYKEIEDYIDGRMKRKINERLNRVREIRDGETTTEG